MSSYDFKKAFKGANAERKRANTVKLLESAAKAYNGKNAARKRRNSVAQFKQVAPYLAGALVGAGDYSVKGVSKYHIDRGIHSSGMHNHAHARAAARERYIPHSAMEKGQMRIVHSEYIGDLVSSATTGSANFVSQSYAINPGNAGTFPWLSSTAINFQNYRFNKLVFEYRPLVSESSSSTAATLLSMGSVMLATQYNSVVGPYTTKQTMCESDFSMTVKPSENALHAIECNPKYNSLGELYISAQTSLTVGAGGSDIRMQNLGIFVAASCNVPIASSTAVDLGELWVHYDVTLFKPQINAYLSGLQSSHYYGTTNCGSPSGSANFGPNITSAIQPASITNNLLALTFGTNSFSFPLQVTSGEYLCVYYCRGSVVTVVTTTPTVVNGTITTSWNNGTLNSTSAFQTGTAPQTALAGDLNIVQTFIVSVNAPGASLCTVTMGITTIPTAGQFDLVVTPYNSAMA